MSRARLMFLALALFVAGPAFAQSSVTGDWNATITGPQGPNTVKVSFTQDGEKVSGRFKGATGELPFTGTLVGNDLKFTFTVQFQGMPLDITLTGKVDGDSIAGKADFGGFVDGDWTATRAPAADAAPASTTTTAGTTTAAATSTTGGGAAGTWDVTLKTPGGDFPAVATIAESAGKLTGTFAGQMGETPVTGTIEGKALKFEMVAHTPNGDLNVVMTGDLDGDSIVNGKADVSGMGQMEWTAKRKQ